jgi:hypothetical protein
MDTVKPDEWRAEIPRFLYDVKPAHISDFGIDVFNLWKVLYRKVCLNLWKVLYRKVCLAVCRRGI